jgi:hypothetical protein
VSLRTQRLDHILPGARLERSVDGVPGIRRAVPQGHQRPKLAPFAGERATAEPRLVAESRHRVHGFELGLPVIAKLVDRQILLCLLRPLLAVSW